MSTIYHGAKVAQPGEGSSHTTGNLCLKLMHKGDRMLPQLFLALQNHTQPMYRALLKEQR